MKIIIKIIKNYSDLHIYVYIIFKKYSIYMFFIRLLLFLFFIFVFFHQLSPVMQKTALFGELGRFCFNITISITI